MSATKLFAQTLGIIDVAGVLNFETFFKLSPPVAGVENATVYTPVGILTEAEALAIIQQSVADKANIETSNVESFTVDDVRGGH
jgi:hypothetical protein